MSKITTAITLILAAVFFLTEWITVAAEPAQETALQDSAVYIPLETYMGMLETVQVKIGGQTMPFIFDTAGGMRHV